MSSLVYLKPLFYLCSIFINLGQYWSLIIVNTWYAKRQWSLFWFVCNHQNSHHKHLLMRGHQPSLQTEFFAPTEALNELWMCDNLKDKHFILWSCLPSKYKMFCRQVFIENSIVVFTLLPNKQRLFWPKFLSSNRDSNRDNWKSHLWDAAT